MLASAYRKYPAHNNLASYADQKNVINNSPELSLLDAQAISRESMLFSSVKHDFNSVSNLSKVSGSIQTPNFSWTEPYYIDI